MNNKAFILALATTLAAPTVTLAAVNYDGEKLSSRYGPTFQQQVQDETRVQPTTIDEVAVAGAGDRTVSRLQNEPNARAQKQEAMLAAQSAEKGKKKKKSGAQAETVSSSQLPVLVYGDKVTYHQETGDFEAIGKVRVYQGTQKLYTTKVEGNINTGDVYLKEGGRLVDGKTVTDGKWIRYNFLTKDGSVQKMEGNNGEDRYQSDEAQIYPDRIEMNKGASTTRCVAVKHSHCFDVNAEKVIIYPNDKIIAYNVKVYLKGKHIYSRDRWINDLTKDAGQSLIPRIGYSKEHGVEVRYNYQQVLSEKNTATAELKYYSKIGWRPLLYDVQDERNFYVKVQNGHTEDSDNNWIKKERDITVGYKSHKFDKRIPLNYSAYASYGLWTDKWNTSWHRETGVFLTHDRINFGKVRPLHLDLGTGYKIVHESVNNSTTNTMLYSATLGKDLAEGWNTWLGYYWEKNQNNLFRYNMPDMARELQFGLTKRFDVNNSLTFINRYDEGKRNIYENIWRYTHDFCCWRLSLEFRDKKYNDEKEWSVNYDLYRW